MIYGEQTRLRRVEREDISTFVRWFSDPKARDFLLLNRPISIAEEERWFEAQLQDESTELFAIETSDGTHIRLSHEFSAAQGTDAQDLSHAG